MPAKRHRNALQPGYRLLWYRIDRILGQGGFGITYLAHDPNLDLQVAIKEYLPVEMVVREQDGSVHPVSDDHDGNYKWGLDRFIAEAQTLARFDHPNIVRVLSVFEQNNTTYMVMRYEQGQSLQELLPSGGTLPEERLTAILFPILDGLGRVHESGFIHRDIKPANIFIREDSSPVLLDFGSARQALGRETKILTTLVSPGFAPFEQYFSKSEHQGTWTDIYGLGATLYCAVTGHPPTDAVERSEGLLKQEEDNYTPAVNRAAGRYSKQLLKAIDHALAFRPEERPQTLNQWRAEFDPASAPPPATEPPTVVAQAPVTSAPVADSEHTERLDEPTIGERSGGASPNRANGISRRTLIGAGLAGFALMLFGLLVWRRKRQRKEKPEPTSALQQHIEEEQRPATTSEADPQVKEPPPAEQPEIETAQTVADPATESEQQLRSLLQQVQEDIKAQRLTSPAGNNVLEKAREALALDPGNREARQTSSRC